MDCKEIREMYKLMFAEYPDIVTVKDLQTMLGISRHTAYDLLGARRRKSCFWQEHLPVSNRFGTLKTAYPTSKVHSPHCRQLTSTAAQTEYAP